MPRPVSAANHKTAKQDLELIREMAARYGDDEIARVLNKLGRKTAKGNRWNSQRVKTGRRRNDIPDPDRSARGLDILSQAEAAAHCGVSTKTIRTLASRGILKYGQIAPHAPWEIQKTDLDAEPVRSICEHLKQTGALVLSGVCPDDQIALLPQNRDRDNGGYYE